MLLFFVPLYNTRLEINAGFSEADSMKRNTDMVIKIIPQRCANDINHHHLVNVEINRKKEFDDLFLSLLWVGVIEEFIKDLLCC